MRVRPIQDEIPSTVTSRPPPSASGRSVLRDLIALRQVGIEVVLAREDRGGLDAAAECQRGGDGVVDGLAVEDRQRAGLTRAHGAHLRIGRGAERRAAAAEDLGLRAQLRVNLEPDDGLVRHGITQITRYARGRPLFIGTRYPNRSGDRSAFDDRLEVVHEHLRQLAGLFVVLGGIGPGAARVQHRRRHAGAACRHVQVEQGVLLVRHAVELAVERGGDHRPRVRDLHAAAGSVRSAGPAGVHQPHTGLVFGDLLAEHPRVDVGVERQERCAEARAERGFRFGHALFGAGHPRRVARQEVVHRRVRREPRDGRQHAVGVGRQHHDIGRVSTASRQFGVVDELDRIRASCVLRQRGVVQIQRAAIRINHHVFQNRAEPASGRVDLRLGLGRELDHLRVAAAFEIEDAGVAPSVLVVADETPLRVTRQRRLPGTREAEEERRVTLGVRCSPSSASRARPDEAMCSSGW